jgi:uncharacterized repeat protein (TIGR01451 family)
MIERRTAARAIVGMARVALIVAPMVLVEAERAQAAAVLTVTPLTWGVIGLDSNDVTVGPNHFPVGARICNTGTTAATNVVATWNWASVNPYLNIRPGTNTVLPAVPTLAAGACTDAYFEVEVTRTPAAYNTTRRFFISVTESGGASGVTPTPRELYVEHLISQSRNSVTNIKYGTSSPSTSVPAGGSMTLLVGQTYFIELDGATATQGYEQLETFVNFPNTIFQVLSVSSTYSADTSTNVPAPNPSVYANGCIWESNPLSPNYRSCLDVGKAGGTISVVYQVKILAVPGAPLVNPEPLSTLIYDFSGSSYHYNSDYSTSTRFAYVLDPAAVTIAKSFTPDTVLPGSASKLTIRIFNPSPNDLGGVNFTDPLPANVTVATPPNVSTSGCGSPTFAPTAGATSLSFSGATIPGNSYCVINVDVTPSIAGTFVNTTGHLFINGTTPGTGIDTGNFATATLTASTSLLTCTTGTMAQWTVPSTATAPPDTTGGLPTTQAINVATATAAVLDTGRDNIVTNNGQNDTDSWRVFGWKTAGLQRIDFVINTKNYSGVSMTYYMRNIGAANGPTNVLLSDSTGGAFTTVESTTNPPDAWTLHTVDLTGLTSTSGNTTLRFTASGANTDGNGGALLFDLITFTGCSFFPPPQLSKAFNTDPIKLNTDTSRLRFTLSNPNPGVSGFDAVALVDAHFADTLPAGLVIVNNGGFPAATTCTSTSGAALALTAVDGTTAISLTGAELAVGASCTVDVFVKGIAAGTWQNVSGFAGSTTSGDNKSASGFGTASITVIAPPAITKAFGATTILTNNTTSLSFTVSNPNVSTTLTGVAFTDTLPAGLVVATPNGLAGSCGGGTITAAAGSGTVSLSGASLTALTTCSFSLNVLGTVAGTKNNSVTVTSTNGGTGNTATATLVVHDPNPAISLLKQVSTSATGPWSAFVVVTPGTTVYYRLQVENTGDVALDGVSVTDPAFSVSGCPTTLAIGAIGTCNIASITSVAGYHKNTATASGGYLGIVVTHVSSAYYSTTGLTLIKKALEPSYSGAGSLIHYDYGVTNTGATSLAGPIVINDDKATVTCPAVTTVGNLDGFLDPGESIECSATFTVPAGPPASVTNTATAQSSDPTPVVSNTAVVTVPVAAAVDFAVTKNDGVTTATAGGPTTYTITVTNAGPSADSATLSDPAAAGLTKTAVGACTASGGATCPTVGAGAGELNVTNLENGTVAIPSMPVGGGISFTVTATVTAAAGGSVTNTVTVTASTKTDVDTSNNTASDTDTVTAPTAALLRGFVAREGDGGVVLEWETSTETRTIGFFLRRRDDGASPFVAVNSELLPAALHSHGGRYVYLDTAARPGVDYEYEVVEVQASGEATTLGRFAVNTDRPAAPRSEPLDPGPTGYARVPRKGPGSAQRGGATRPGVEQGERASAGRIPAQERRGGAQRPTGGHVAVKLGSSVKLGLSEEGLYFVGLADLAGQGLAVTPMGLAGSRNLHGLTNGGRQIAYAHAPDLSGILFYGQPPASVFTRDNVYRLGEGPGNGTLMRSRREVPSRRPTGGETFLRTVHAEVNAVPAIALFSDPEADFWLWDWVFAGWGVKTFAFRADDLAEGAGEASIHIRLQGSSDSPAENDHHAIFRINGSAIGELFFDGLQGAETTLSFPTSLLHEGDNSLEIEGILEAGVPYSLFYLDSFDVRYRSIYRAHDDRITCPADGNVSLLVGGFSRPDVMSFDVTDPRHPVIVQAAVHRAPDGTYAVALAPPTAATVYHVVTPAAVRRVSWLEPDTPSSLRRRDNAGEYLIVTTAALKGAAQELADLHPDLRSMVVDIEDVYDEFNDGIPSPHALHRFLTYARRFWDVPPRYVVLAGDGSYDYRDLMGEGGNLVPPMLVATPEGLYPSDAWFVDDEAAPAPAPSIGRLPATSAAELERLIAKIRLWEASAGAPWLGHWLFVSDNADVGGDFPRDADDLSKLVPAQTLVERIDVSRQGGAGARAALLAGLQDGAGRVFYVGHGGYDILAEEGLLRSEDVDGLQNPPTLLVAMTCLVNNFALPGDPTLGERLVRKDVGGSVAVWAPTGLSVDELAVRLGASFMVAAKREDARLGDAISEATNEYRAASLPPYLPSIYVLLGDPAMKLH